MKDYKGLPGAGGIALGKVVYLEKQEIVIEKKSVNDTQAEIEKFRKVQEEYSNELDELYEITKESIGETEAEIFNAYKMIAKDEYFFGNVFKQVEKESINIDYAINEEKKKTAEMFLSMPDPYMRDRGVDIENVCDEIINRINGVVSTESKIGKIKEPFIVIAKDLTPADTVRIDKTYLRGFVTQKGGVTSHVVILAKTLAIPAIVGAADILEAKDASDIYINGTTGEIIVDPDKETIAAYKEQEKKMEKEKAYFDECAKKSITTKDGKEVLVCINSGDADSIDTFEPEKCDGVGLFRTEFVYMNERDYPSEEKQFNVYKEMLEKANGKEVIIRTLDIGGDKQLDYMDMPKEDNPFLGYRAIRLCLDRREVFKTQLRALLRAGEYGNLKIMFPMIVTYEELMDAKGILDEAKKELESEGVSLKNKVPVGIMIETPAAVLLSDKLAEVADFFSIGTNDLIQYTTATDRMNEKVQYLYTPYNISVLTAIAKVIENGHKQNIPVGMCGEASSDPNMVPVLLGMGLDEFSVVPSSVGRIKSILMSLSYEEMKEHANKVLAAKTIDEVEKIMASLSV